MARAIWSGSISFGLVNIPVKLYNAVSRKNVSFNQIDARTQSRVKMQRVNADGDEVPYEHIVKGYELSPDRYVLIEPEELDALDPEATHTVDIEQFIDLAEIDPIFYDSAYYVAPVKAAEKPYALLVRAMEEQQKVAIARFVMRTKQYLAAIRSVEGRLMMSTMVFADEVVPAETIPGLEDIEDEVLTEREMTMAISLVESMSGPFEPEKYHDTYREEVLALIERKAEGLELEAPTTTAPSANVVDLMAALEQSVKDAKEARQRHPARAATEQSKKRAKARDAEEEAEPEKVAPKRRVRKSA
jgi:DNA end-binding protein Ku